MRLISHRGNLDSVQHDLENTPDYIDAAIAAGFDVEIDVWRKDGALLLGHDGPERPVERLWLYERRDKLWIHCKNVDAATHLLDFNFHVFFHEKERHVIIGNSYLVWTHDLSEANARSVIPLLSEEEAARAGEYKHVWGICSDFVKKL